MSRDHLTDTVGVYDAGEEDEGDEMVVENVGLEVEIGENHGPEAEERHKAKQCPARAVAPSTARADDVDGRLNGVEDEDDGALDKVPVDKGHVVDDKRNASILGNTKIAEEALLPERTAANVSSYGMDGDENQDALNRSVDDAEREGLGVVLVPGLYIKSERS